MVSKILLFIRTDEAATSEGFLGQPVSDGLQTHYCTMKETVRIEEVTSEIDKTIMEIVNEIAKERGMAVEVYDLANFKGRIKASINGIRRTPTAIIGKQKLEGALTRGQIVAAITAETSK